MEACVLVHTHCQCLFPLLQNRCIPEQMTIRRLVQHLHRDLQQQRTVRQEQTRKQLVAIMLFAFKTYK